MIYLTFYITFFINKNSKHTFSLVISFTNGQSDSLTFSAGFKNSTFFLLATI